MNKRTKIIFSVIAALLIALLVWLGFNTVATRATELSWTEFNQYVMNGKADEENGGNTETVAQKEDELKLIVHVEIHNYKVYGFRPVADANGGYQRTEDGYYKYERNYSYTTVMKYGDSTSESFIDAWQSVDGVTIEFTDPNSGSIWSSVISTLGIVVVCVIFWIIISRTAGGGGKAMSFGKTKAKVTTNIKVRFTDVAGAEEEKAELQEIVEFLKQPQKYVDLGARIPKGVLLEGPPGTGKTLFAKAVAGEAGVPFFSVSGSDFVEMYVGVGASRVRDLFEIAKRNQPCIIFIDEIDAVGRERGAGLGGGSDEREQTLNQILVQMDGFEANEAIIVMAATNRSDVLDPALMRPGRFDRKITVNLPDVKGREAILRVHARNKPLEPSVNFKTVARMTSGFSGADLANLLNEAAILAVRAGKKLIGNLELYEGINKVLMGPQKKSYVVTESDKRCTAYHESGHAIIAQVCKQCDPVQEVSIIPRGNAAGYTLTRPDSDDKDVSKNKLIDMLCMMLGGRVAEELVIKDVTTGASNDLQRVSALARKMVTEWGMSDKLGLISYGDGEPIFIGRQMGKTQEYSEATASLIDQEVRRIIEEAHERAVTILTENRTVLDNMARLLVERETIYSEEVNMLMKGATVAEVLAYMEKQDSASPDNPFARFEAAYREDGKTGKADSGKSSGADGAGDDGKNDGPAPIDEDSFKF